MSLTPSDRHYHRRYEAASHELRYVIDDAYHAVANHLVIDAPSISGEFLKAVGDDRAEALIAAITRFVFESNPSHPAVIAALESAAKEDGT